MENKNEVMTQIVTEEKIPKFLQDDIDAYIAGYNSDDSCLDCLWCELYASLNAVEREKLLSPELITQMRKYYLKEKV